MNVKQLNLAIKMLFVQIQLVRLHVNVKMVMKAMVFNAKVRTIRVLKLC